MVQASLTCEHADQELHRIRLAMPTLLAELERRLHAPTPLRPRLRERRRVLGGLTEPSSVNRSHSKP